jgi:penicillin V acylase-like amidase (Ntn superfamily)
MTARPSAHRIAVLAAALAAGVACVTGPAGPAGACSVFSLSSVGHTTTGRNLDWDVPLPGCVVVSPRGLEKTVLPWKGGWPEGRWQDARDEKSTGQDARDEKSTGQDFRSEDGPGQVGTGRDTVSWTSVYGSVTFTCYGRDFIESGMNEAGLVMTEASLGAEYPPDDGRPGVSCTQWMQYQLDNFATVAEVVEHIDDLRPDGEGFHHLVSDAAGDCAVIEYEDGRPLIYTGEDVVVCAITNTTHSRALGHLSMDSAFGGDSDIRAGSDSYGRFVRMADMMRDYEPPGDGAQTDYALSVLGEVESDETLRSVVYDCGGMRVLWRTSGNRDVRWLTMESLDLSPGAPVLMLDIDAGGLGDASRLLVEYTLEANRATAEAVLGSGDGRADIEKMLAGRRLTFDEAVELVAGHPTAGD